MARSSSPDLNGVYAKLARGQRHLNHLNDVVRSFLDDRPYRAVVEDGPNPSDYVLRGQIVKRPPVYDFGVLIGDCVHNLRSALDHMVWELGGNTSANPKFIAFPVYWRKTGKNGFDQNAPRMLDGVPSPIKDAIRAVQPYRRRRRNDSLWVLHDLWLKDKHQTLQIVQSVAMGWIINHDYVSDLVVIEGPFKDGDIVATYRASRSQTEVGQDASVYFSVAFDKKGPGRGFPLIGVLQSAQEKVAQIFLTLKGLAEQL